MSGSTIVRAATLEFGSTGPIAITSHGPADPYPSSIAVADVAGTLTSVRVTLHSFIHSYPDDLAAVVLGPNGEAVRLFDGPGSDVGEVVTWTFSDTADSMLPDFGPLSSGTYQPGQNEYYSVFPQVAGPIGSHFSVFAGSTPNGLWSLYVIDMASFDSGSISSWHLELDVVPSAATPEPGTLLSAAGAVLLLIGMRQWLPRCSTIKQA